MSGSAGELARRLARDAEAVCRYYLSNGCRMGRYWTVGNVQNAPGRSLYVRLQGPESGPGAAGKWTDAATGEHGDLLDLIALNRGLDRLKAMGLISEIISWRLRLFVPVGANGPAILATVMYRHPLARISERPAV